MKRSFAFIVGFFVVASASAGVRIETVERNIASGQVTDDAQTIRVQDGNLRVSSRGDGTVIMKGDSIYVLDDKSKVYREMDRATLESYAKQASSMMAQMRERMAAMPPQQREMMEKMMGGMAPGMGSAKPDVYEARNTGRSDKVDGRACQVVNLLRNGTVTEELCVVPFSTLPGKEDLQAAFKRLAEVFEGLTSAMPNAQNDMKIRGSIDGFPIRTRSFANGKPDGTEQVLKTWVEEAIPAAMFSAPAGYKKEAMPKMPAMDEM